MRSLFPVSIIQSGDATGVTIFIADGLDVVVVIKEAPKG